MKLSKMVCLFAVAALGATSFGAGLNSQSYVQDGLITQFDAIENVGIGQHDDNAATWRDLKGSAFITIPSDTKWIDRAFDAAKVTLTATGMPSFYLDSVSSEIAMNNLGHSSNGGFPRPFYHPGGDGFYTIYFSPNHDIPQFYIGNNSNSRPSFVSFKQGTLGTASDTTSYRAYTDGSYNSCGASAMAHTQASAANWTFNWQLGYLQALYRAFRHYNRALTDDELKLNAWIDQVRFFSFQLSGSGETVAWSAANWTAPYGRTETCPLADTNDVARIIGAKVSVTAADGVMLKGLSLEDGATLELASGAEVCTRAMFAEGKKVSRGVYTGSEGTLGTKVDWIKGAGYVRVAGENAWRFPYITTGLGAHSYVQDGLVTLFDAIDNVGSGTHDATAAKWLDLAGTASLTLTANTSWREGRYFEKGGDGKPVYFGQMPYYKRDSMTCDVPINIHENAAMDGVGNYPRIFGNAESFSIYFIGDSKNAQVYINAQSQDYRPNLGEFRIGTVAAFSGAKNFGGAKDGVIDSSKSSWYPATNQQRKAAANWEFGYGGKILATYGGLRFYNRCLTEDELKWNTLIDKFRYFSYRAVNESEDEVAWSDLTWSIPEGETASAPSAMTNQYAAIVGGTVTVAATDNVALLGLSLENGAKLKVADGATVSVKLLYVNGQSIDHCIYTGEGGTVGDVVDWIEGKGQVRVAGSADRIIPSVALQVGADGWYTFGYANGSENLQRQIVAERAIWDSYWFPKGERKLRLKDYVLIDTVPDIFAEYDTTQLKCVYVNGYRAYEADRPFEVPKGATFRFLPGVWTTTNEYTHTVNYGANSTAMAQTTGDIELASSAHFLACGDGMPNLTYGGLISGYGNLKLNSYGRQMRFTGGFAINGGSSGNWQNGSGCWVDTLAVTSSLQTITLGGCTDIHGMKTSYSASYIMFGYRNSAETADHPLNIARLNGNASSRVDANGFRWRSGGHVLVWGSNTVHISDLHAGIHAVNSRSEQNCDNGYLNGAYGKSVGPGFLNVDTFSTGTIWGSTNVALVVGTVASGTGFDYTYQSNGVNRLTLDITNSCAAATTIKATDLAMLPARISGFKGSVSLTDTTEKSYEIPIDLSAGTAALYNTVGCIGSGTLAAAPETSTINITFPTDGEIKPGRYSVARFLAGGALLNGWTVTMNGESVMSKKIGEHDIVLKRDQSGIWLGVDLPGLTMILK